MKKASTAYIFCGILVLLCAAACEHTAQKTREQAADNKNVTDPLPSWRDGALKHDIVDYVTRVTDPASKDFIPTASRIATFDNDGTLWPEKPLMQELFAFYRVGEMVKANPPLAKKQPYKAVIAHNKDYFTKGGEKTFIQLIMATHTGMSEEEFERSVNGFFATAAYPRGNVPVKQIIYQPQVELLSYLRANGFKVFICTGGTVEFVRGISQALYGVPAEQVMGTTFKYKYNADSNDIIREPSIVHITDKDMKPVMIQEHIGRRPVFACGNEGGQGDIAMLRYSQGSKYASFQMLVNHDDSAREFYYQEADDSSLHMAAKNHWHVISMKNDWSRVFQGR